MLSIEDHGHVVDFFWYDKLIAKLDRKATIDGVHDQLMFHLFDRTKLLEIQASVEGALKYNDDIKKAKLKVYKNVCSPKLKECDHLSCMCFNCWTGFENPEKCKTCDYREWCDK